MLQERLRHFMASPLLEGEKGGARAAHLLHRVLRMYLIACVAAAGIFIPFVAVRKPGMLVIACAFLLVLAGAYALLRADRVRFASVVLVAGAWGIATGQVLLSGGIVSPPTAYYAMLPVLAGLLLGRRVAVAAAVGCIVSLAGIGALETIGWLPPRYFFFPIASAWATLLLAIVFVTISLNVALRDLAEALRDARKQLAERERAEATLLTRTQQLEAIRAASEEITRELDLPTLLALILRRASELLGTGLATLYLWDETRQVLVPQVWHGMGEETRELLLGLGEGVAGAAAERREGLIVNDFRSSPHMTPLLRERTSHVGVVAEPLLYQGRLLGAITVDNSDPRRRFTEQDQQLLRLFASQAVVAIENARLFAEVNQSLQDVRKAQDALVRSENLRALGQMAAGIAHDINNTLATILGQVQLLRRRDPHSEIQGALSLLETAASDGASIVRRLQDFSRQRPSTPLTPIALEKVIDEAVNIARPRWKDEAQRQGREIDIRVEATELPPILGHAADIREALANLLFNAMDAMPAGGRITLRGFPTSEGVALAVADTGVGMPPEVSQHIFEPFFTTKGLRGTGLGLSVVYGIMERHGGRIDVSSALGRGTTFTLHFQAASSAEILPPRTAPTETPARRLLLIDDDPLVRQTLADLLRAAGQTVLEADGGPTGLSLLADYPVDVVFTDLGMPDMTGWEVAEKIRERLPGLPIVLLTGWGDHLREEDHEARFVDRILAKPVQLDQLLAVIAELTPDGAHTQTES